MKGTGSIHRFIIFACLSIVFAGLYYFLGGFEPLEVHSLNGAKRFVIGREFIIPDDNKAFNAKMDSAKNELVAGRLDGILTAVIYQDTSRIDSVKCFIGVARDRLDGAVSMPAGYSYRTFESSKIYKLVITQSRWVAPTPDEIEELMQARAEKAGEVLNPYTFELYDQDGSLSIEKWVR